MVPVRRCRPNALNRPAQPPIPTTEPTAPGGNMSLTVVNRLADHHWCAPAATLPMPTATHMLPAVAAHMAGRTQSAATSNAALPHRFTLQPSRISAPDRQPPVI